jgi:hypothetical protein
MIVTFSPDAYVLYSDCNAYSGVDGLDPSIPFFPLHMIYSSAHTSLRITRLVK